MTFVQRDIDVTFKLGEGAFGDSGSNEVTVSGLRVVARIIKAGGPSMGTALLQVYGMTLDKMNQLSTLGMMPTLVRRNVVTVTAGDKTDGMGTVFVGTITNAWGDFRGAPEVPFIVEAHTGLIEAVATATPSSYSGAAKVDVIMSSLATKMGLAFENNGVDQVLASPYLSGSYRDQAYGAAKAAGIEIIIDNGKLAIWKRGGSRGDTAVLIAPPTMDGYPSYTSKGISVRSIFLPSLTYGGKIKVQSDLTPANGDWIIYSLDLDLESQNPGGRWHATMGAARPGLVVVR